MKKLLLVGALLASSVAFSGQPTLRGYGNQTAYSAGGNVNEVLNINRDLYIGHAEQKNPQQDYFSDIGEGRERADQVNGKSGYGENSWAYDPSQNDD